MTIRIEDAAFSRTYLRLTLADVRRKRPGIKVSDAEFVCTRTTDHQGYRWMTFEFEGVTCQGYFANAYEGKAKGWDAWLQAVCSREEEDAILAAMERVDSL